MIIEYLIYFIVTILLSTLFAVAGLGSAVGLVPSLNIVGVSFEFARTSGLFVNALTTITTSLLNLKRGVFESRFVAPLVISSVLFALVGAQISLIFDVEVVKTIFAITLLVIASMILFFKKPIHQKSRKNRAVLLFSGAVGGFFSGFLGIGGGSIISPILLLFGYDAKKIAIGISFVIPLSSIVGFASYASVIDLDYILLAVVGVAAIIGGMMGNYILHFKISSTVIKKILALALYLIALKMLLI
ncbi:MAG TPA: sulfite exporter TauE/SafE family protein [Campylobacterales bacterium]|nr:sulfite exporter TauE/SafE family protein [Campylobacterales bacterium]